ncbi:hypothetical protein RND71_019147 [Anisodus tanguticus]|uniref:Uncharacterized protein n=1 Tax=Anisodus tanguticus TaxID=243964 RepID=A0AAE1RYV6_9SOLA|nr:hypothetical protein RND71_019147 [Anisodus tanguticus]
MDGAVPIQQEACGRGHPRNPPNPRNQQVPPHQQKRSFVNVDDDDGEVMPHRVDEQPKEFESNIDGKLPIVDELIEKSEGVKKITKLQIDKLMDKIDDLMEGESSHAPGKGPEVQGTKPRAKEAPPTKEILVSSEGMISIDQLKKFIEGTIKNKYEIVAKLTVVDPNSLA